MVSEKKSEKSVKDGGKLLSAWEEPECEERRDRGLWGKAGGEEDGEVDGRESEEREIWKKEEKERRNQIPRDEMKEGLTYWKDEGKEGKWMTGKKVNGGEKQKMS